MKADQFIQWPSEPTQVALVRAGAVSGARLAVCSVEVRNRSDNTGRGVVRPQPGPQSAVEQRSPGSTRRDYRAGSRALAALDFAGSATRTGAFLPVIIAWVRLADRPIGCAALVGSRVRRATAIWALWMSARRFWRLVIGGGHARRGVDADRYKLSHH
jgi:hypothetical protein